MRNAKGLARFRNIRLFWKLLLPFFFLLVVMGVTGAFLIVRDLSSRAQAALDGDLARRSFNAEALIHDRELYLVDTVRFAVNISGMPEAVARAEVTSAATLLRSILALREEIDLLLVTAGDGRGLVEFTRQASDRSVVVSRRQPDVDGWAKNPMVHQTLAGSGEKTGGFLRGTISPSATDERFLAVAAPIITEGTSRGRVLGVAVAGIRLADIASEIATRVGASSSSAVRIYDAGDHLLASAGFTRSMPPPPSHNDRPVRRAENIDGVMIASLYSPIRIAGVHAGVLGVSVPTQAAFSSVRGAAYRLATILLLAMAAVVAIGSVLSRSILAQLRPLLRTNRAFGAGDLTARVPVLGLDELGEVAAGFNAMADQLQASVEELERRVLQRTQELERLYQELKRASDARAEFFAAVSHEFRTPLFAITGHADMMLDSRVTSLGKSWRREFGTTIKEASEHLLHLINEILDLAKFEARRMEVELAEVSFGEVVRETQRTVNALARRSDLTFTVELEDHLPLVKADRTRLKEILLNLTSNAIKYTPAGGSVRLAASTKNGQVQVSVIDTGVGIPDEESDRIFEPFYQVKGTKTQRGQASSGLGLALTKRLVEAQGGSIWFVSKPGVGSTFSFTLLRAERGQKSPARSRRAARRGRA